jgi:hypothetical protein
MRCLEFDDVVIECRFVLSADLMVQRMSCHWDSWSRASSTEVASVLNVYYEYEVNKEVGHISAWRKSKERCYIPMKTWAAVKAHMMILK